MSADLSDHLFITLDTPMGSNVVSVYEALFAFIGLFISQRRSEGSEN